MHFRRISREYCGERGLCPLIGIDLLLSTILILLLLLTTYGCSKQEIADSNTNTNDPLSVSIQFDGLDASSSPVPISIVSAEDEDEPYEQHILLTDFDNASVIELPDGHYKISVESSPILADGTMFDISHAFSLVSLASGGLDNTEEIAVFVIPDGQSLEDMTNNRMSNIVLEKLNAPKITQDVIDSSISVLRNCGVDEERLQTLREAAIQKLVSSTPDPYLSELYYDCPLYSVVLPETMEGSYTIDPYYMGTENIVLSMSDCASHFEGYKTAIREPYYQTDHSSFAVAIIAIGPYMKLEGDVVTKELGSINSGDHVVLYVNDNFPDAQKLLDEFSPYVHVKQERSVLDYYFEMGEHYNRSNFEYLFNKLNEEYDSDDRKNGSVEEQEAFFRESFEAYDRLLDAIIFEINADAARDDLAVIDEQNEQWKYDRKAARNFGENAKILGVPRYVARVKPGIEMTKTRISSLIQTM